ncbi:hypothetical protein BC937DRAFT_86386 [Endogone sp. FLAS-F59071]|nr:hypothetical protein BC937DRAFT_86386 [Endogone sp. FLAS-F59071]|eukprot:RUS13077.1 hypothetical protein BC937DRAFT_86386 [Endogone sp. FLAS-F59071]
MPYNPTPPLRPITSECIQDPEVLAIINSVKAILANSETTGNANRVARLLLGIHLALRDHIKLDQEQYQVRLNGIPHEVEVYLPLHQAEGQIDVEPPPSESFVGTPLKPRKKPRGRPRKAKVEATPEPKIETELPVSKPPDMETAEVLQPPVTSEPTAQKLPAKRKACVSPSPTEVKLISSMGSDSTTEPKIKIEDVKVSDNEALLSGEENGKRLKVKCSLGEDERDEDGEGEKDGKLKQEFDKDGHVVADTSDEEIVFENQQRESTTNKQFMKRNKVRERMKGYLHEKLDCINDQTLHILCQTFLIRLDPKLDIDGAYTPEELIRMLHPMLDQRAGHHLANHHDFYRVFLRLQPHLLAKIQDGGCSQRTTALSSVRAEDPKSTPALFTQIIRALSAELDVRTTGLRLAVREGKRVYNLARVFGPGVLALNYILKPHKLAELGDEQWSRMLKKMEKEEGEWMQKMKKKYGAVGGGDGVET